MSGALAWELLLLGLLAAFLPLGGSEVFPYGNDPRHPHHAPGSHWDYSSAGLDWAGSEADGTPWSCLMGQRQSPVHLPLPTHQQQGTLPASKGAPFNGLGSVPSNGSNIQILNNGHTVMVTFLSQGSQPSIALPVPVSATNALDTLKVSTGMITQLVQAQLQQVHFHTASEHVVAGRLYPLEMHMVFKVPRGDRTSACPPEGCHMVVAVLWELGPVDHDQLQQLWSVMPLEEQVANMLPAGATVDLGRLLPAVKSYQAYEGSLTTPPCTESVLWLVLTEPLQLSMQQWALFLQAVGGVNCSAVTGASSGVEPAAWNCSKLRAGANHRLPQPLNGRAVHYWRDPTAALASGGGSEQQPASVVPSGLLAGVYFAGAATVGVMGAGYWLWRQPRLRSTWGGRRSQSAADTGFEMESTWLRMPPGSSTV